MANPMVDTYGGEGAQALLDKSDSILPFTGSDPLLLALTGAVLVGVGAGVAWAAKRWNDG